jgi:hypothetical protein
MIRESLKPLTPLLSLREREQARRAAPLCVNFTGTCSGLAGCSSEHAEGQQQ